MAHPLLRFQPQNLSLKPFTEEFVQQLFPVSIFSPKFFPQTIQGWNWALAHPHPHLQPLAEGLSPSGGSDSGLEEGFQAGGSHPVAHPLLSPP